MFRNRLTRRSDEDLMRLVQQGASDAFAEIYWRYSTPMVRYFYRMLWKDQHKAQDFLHDLFLKIVERPEHFDVNKKFSTWLYSVAHNMCKNEYRKQQFRKTQAGLPATHEPSNEVPLMENLDQQAMTQMLEAT